MRDTQSGFTYKWKYDLDFIYLFSGGDSGLDGLGGPGVQLGSPDKKKRKTNTQVT